jgi:hypothetical protein
MPAFPKLRDGFCEIRAVKVVHQAKAHDLGGTDSDVGVTRKIAVNLKGKEHGGDDQGESSKAVGIVIHRVDGDGEAISNDNFFEQTPDHQFQTIGDSLVIEVVFRIELVKKVLWAFDGTCDKLGIKHHIKGVDTKMMFGFLATTVNFDDIAETLKRVERQTDGQRKFEGCDGVVPVEHRGKVGEVSIKKVEILENEENEAGGQNADCKDSFAFMRRKSRFFQPDASDVVDDDRYSEDDDIFGDKHHVKDATGDEQHPPAVTMREQEIQQRHNRKENQKLERIEKH